MLTDEQKKQAGQAFDYLDEQKEGHVTWSKDTLQNGARLAGLNPNRKEVTDLYEELDRCQPTVTKQQFLEIIEKFEWHETETATEQLVADFRLLDPGICDSVDRRFLCDILSREGSDPLPPDDVDELVSLISAGTSGDISLHNMIQKLLSPVSPESD